ncbi:MAG: CBS domain-containing protein [Bellilinea sp.]
MMHQVRHILQLKGDHIWTISPDDTVFEALRLMATKGAGALVVTKDEKMVGIISERDYARKVILKGRTSRDTLVSEIMTSQVFTIHPDQTIEECMELMTDKRVRHLPVIENDKLIGVISIGDVLKNIIYRQRQMISEMEDKVRGKIPEVIEPEVPRFAGWGKKPVDK